MRTRAGSELGTGAGGSKLVASFVVRNATLHTSGAGADAVTVCGVVRGGSRGRPVALAATTSHEVVLVTASTVVIDLAEVSEVIGPLHLGKLLLGLLLLSLLGSNLLVFDHVDG